MSTKKVASQGGILEGMNPTKYNLKDPLQLFIIQATLIIVFCRLLHWPLAKIRQPTVIAEVIGGILLGPTAFGRIPGFKATIFPQDSMVMLTLTANLGLVLFLFLVGLEVDMRMLTANYKVALSVAALGMIIPFGLGVAVAYGLYNQFVNKGMDDDVPFGIFVLFIGVAMAITAFPVLARILTELKLLRTNVGTIVLSAGVGNDVVGWVLLALTVTLINAGNGVTALYVFLVTVAWVLFLVYAVRPAFIWVLRKNGALERGPSQGMVALTLLMVLASAFFTNIIGVHAIFGGFLVGLICPHDGGFAIKLTEKIEDLVSVIFLPLYFALSGLRTDIGLLKDGMVWGYVFAVLFVAFFGKFIGGAVAARITGMLWRESATIGVLMSCKGLVELIVLNIGLDAGIIEQDVFTIFVVMALVTTFATTPLTTFLYPPSYQRKVAAWRRGEIDWQGNQLRPGSGTGSPGTAKIPSKISRVTVFLRLDSLPSLFTFINLLGTGSKVAPVKRIHKAKKDASGSSAEEEELQAKALAERPVKVHGLRVVELTDRTSTVMKVSEQDEHVEADPVLKIFKTFGRQNHLAVSTGFSISPSDSFAETVSERAADQHSELLLVPWSQTGSICEMSENQSYSAENRFTSAEHNRFISRLLHNAPSSIAVLVDRGFGGATEDGLKRVQSYRSIKSNHMPDDNLVHPFADLSHHVFFPYFGGIDDRMAMRFVLQLAANSHVTATIVMVTYSSDAPDVSAPQVPGAAARKDLPRMLSDSNVPTLATDSLAAAAKGAVPAKEEDSTFFDLLTDSLPEELAERVLFEKIVTSRPLDYVLQKAAEELGGSDNAGDLLVVGRRITDGTMRNSIRDSLIRVLNTSGVPSGVGSETRESLGDVAEAAIVAGLKASVLVMQGK